VPVDVRVPCALLNRLFLKADTVGRPTDLADHDQSCCCEVKVRDQLKDSALLFLYAAALRLQPLPREIAYNISPAFVCSQSAENPTIKSDVHHSHRPHLRVVDMAPVFWKVCGSPISPVSQNPATLQEDRPVWLWKSHTHRFA
jgi:hypothetical protein